MLFGSRLAHALLYDSTSVFPDVLTASSFQWTLPTIDDALHHLLGGHAHDHH